MSEDTESLSTLVRDILPASLSEVEPHVLIEAVTDLIINRSDQVDRTRTPGKAKDIDEFFTLVKTALDNHYTLTKVEETARVILTEEDIDKPLETETITYKIVRREPGSFSQGAPFESKVRNLKPLLRDIVTDPDEPAYKIVSLGYFHDNRVRFTAWARTCKAANARALWFEKFMLEYDWFFRFSGVARVIFVERGMDQTMEKSDQRLFGRPMDFYVRTEYLVQVRQVAIRQLLLHYGVGSE